MFFFIFFGNNQCMKKIAMISTFLLVLVLMIGVCFQNNVKTKDENCDYLRIHIRANSNEQVDQDIKFVIKDQFVCFLTPKIADCKAKKDKNCKEIGEKNYLNQGEELELKHEIKSKEEKFDEEMINNVTLKYKELCGKKLLGQKSFFN